MIDAALKSLRMADELPFEAGDLLEGFLESMLGLEKAGDWYWLQGGPPELIPDLEKARVRHWWLEGHLELIPGLEKVCVRRW